MLSAQPCAQQSRVNGKYRNRGPKAGTIDRKKGHRNENIKSQAVLSLCP